MPAQSFFGVLCTGHGPYPPRANNSTPVSSVFVNNKLALVVGAGWPNHQKPPDNPNPHPGVASAGSGTVFFENSPAVRIGDPVDCGSAVSEGSADVITGG